MNNFQNDMLLKRTSIRPILRRPDSKQAQSHSGSRRIRYGQARSKILASEELMGI